MGNGGDAWGGFVIAGLLAAACVAAVLWLTIKFSEVTAADMRKDMLRDDRQPTPVDRLAGWELRLGEYLAQQHIQRGQHRAQERLRQHSSRLAFDSRATVQPKVTPKLPR